MKKILVIDDEKSLNTLTSDYLRMSGYEVDSCFDAESALAFLARDPCFDLIILDKRMPGMGGVAAGKAIRAAPTTASIPILMLSATIQPSQIGDPANEFHADAYLLKPFSPKALVAMIGELLGIRE